MGINSANMRCTQEFRTCDSSLNPETEEFTLGHAAKSIPLSICETTCSNMGYYSQFFVNILIKILLPIIAGYMLSCIIVFLFQKIKK